MNGEWIITEVSFVWLLVGIVAGSLTTMAVYFVVDSRITVKGLWEWLNERVT